MFLILLGIVLGFFFGPVVGILVIIVGFVLAVIGGMLG